MNVISFRTRDVVVDIQRIGALILNKCSGHSFHDLNFFGGWGLVNQSIAEQCLLMTCALSSVVQRFR